MENHPIPQDITGFQFKLIGDMTIKQFAYLAGGAIAGWITYISPLLLIIKLPLALFFIATGTSLAFLPVAGRPLDTMVANFIKAMFSSTQFVYEKSGGHLYAQANKHLAKNKKGESSQETQVNSIPKTETDEKKKEMVYFSSLASMYGDKPLQNQMNVTPVVSTPHSMDKVAPTLEAPQVSQPNPDEKKKESQMEAHEQELEKELALAKQQQASQDPILAQKARQETLALSEDLRKTIDEKNRLEEQLIALNKKLDEQKANVFTPGTVQAPKQTQNVRVVPQGLGNSVGLPITPDSPNVISGIVKDPRGNPLPNILVEVKDADQTPVRAFKTNGVGQFASATALTNGVYTIDFEDPKEENRFDSIQFEAKGDIILPIEVISVDKREELRRELFN